MDQASLPHAATRVIAPRGDARIAAWARGAGPLVVLLPSLGRGAEDFDELAALLAAGGMRVLCPEPRGIGGSQGPMEGLDLFDLAADALAAVDALAGPQACFAVAGHAFGNWVARALATREAARVRGVVLLAASLGTDINPLIRPSINGSFDRSLTDAQRLEHLRRGYFAPGNDASVWLGGWHPDTVRMQRAATAATPDTSWQRVAERLPTLYVAPAQDTIAPVPSMERLHEALGPMAERAVIPDAGHALLPEQPAATAEAMLAFLRRLPA